MEEAPASIQCALTHLFSVSRHLHSVLGPYIQCVKALTSIQCVKAVAAPAPSSTPSLYPCVCTCVQCECARACVSVRVCGSV